MPRAPVLSSCATAEGGEERGPNLKVGEEWRTNNVRWRKHGVLHWVHRLDSEGFSYVAIRQEVIVGLFIIDEKGSVPISNGPYPISEKRKEGGYGKTQEDRTEKRN